MLMALPLSAFDPGVGSCNITLPGATLSLGTPSGRRQEHLAPVPGREQPCYSVHGRTEVVPVSLLGRPGVQGHPHLDLGVLVPVFGEEGPLGR